MSSLNAPLNLELKPSRTGFAGELAAHAVVAAALVFSSPPLWLHLVAGLLWGASLIVTIRRRNTPSAGVQGIAQHESGWKLALACGMEPAELIGRSFITVPVMVLRFRLARSGKTARVVVWHDSGNADDIRRLRVRLLHGEAD